MCKEAREKQDQHQLHQIGGLELYPGNRDPPCRTADVLAENQNSRQQQTYPGIKNPSEMQQIRIVRQRQDKHCNNPDDHSDKLSGLVRLLRTSNDEQPDRGQENACPCERETVISDSILSEHEDSSPGIRPFSVVRPSLACCQQLPWNFSRAVFYHEEWHRTSHPTAAPG